MLNELFDKYGTDKGNLPNCPTRGHAYGDFYEKKLSHLIDKPIRLLEIGVCSSDVCRICNRQYHGYPRQPHSLLAWRDYFPYGEIVGIDRDDCSDFDYDRITIYQGNQGNPEDLYKTMENGTFDVIIDDGSHFYIHQIYTMTLMMPLMKKDGIYIIEDIDLGNDWSKNGYTVKGKMVENYPYQVGAFCTLLHNMGFVKADCFNDQYGAFQTIALERNMD